MNFLPKILLDKEDLKRTVNSLMLEEDAIPKPSLKRDMPPEIKKPTPEPIEENKQEQPKSDPSG